MPSLAFPYPVNGTPRTVTISQVAHGGGGWQVYCSDPRTPDRKWYEGTIRLVQGQWVRHGPDTSDIQGDDWAGLIDLIDELEKDG